jgi:branched-chain amino acid transport system substrate-binding protein
MMAPAQPDKTVGTITHEEISDMRNGIFRLLTGTALAIAL